MKPAECGRQCRQQHRPRYWQSWLAVLMLVWVMCLMPQAQAAGIAVFTPRIEADGEGYGLSADFMIDLPPRIEEVINRGIELHFVVDFELTRSRWYWFDARIAQRSRTYRLSYHALTRRYRLSTGGLHQGFATLNEALRVLARLRNWPVADQGDLSPDVVYLAALRMRLDLSQMPKTFQVSARAKSEWNLDSGWLRWRFQPPAADVSGAPAADAGPIQGGKAPIHADQAAGAAEPAGEATKEPDKVQDKTLPADPSADIPAVPTEADFAGAEAPADGARSPDLPPAPQQEQQEKQEAQETPKMRESAP